ncbi:(Fe-S)-binding protein [Pandoraea pnomenusa]|uniref:(Fe-S)-binding protein n=1 Tax=Pandoraea pnomenusa TaxID=93220 RepID=UPI0011987F49|nr:(Fe-S)-binding protein [Pandoraea pnomenusa]QDX20294.1 (Fe-S)-binding protein [Pandoraea pnomenusa]
MKVALFVPCFIDALFPEVGIATLELLEKLGVTVDYPRRQTCCGQPLVNNGCEADAAGTEALFVENFAGYECIVSPSSSCVHHVRKHLSAAGESERVATVRANTYELTEFLHDILQVRDFPWANFPHTVGLHNSCSAIRHLHAASASEIPGEPWSKARTLLEGVPGIRFAAPRRPDECCGFGGTFSVSEQAVSVKMGEDKVRDHFDAGAQFIVSADMSCLMHQKGCAARTRTPMRFLHIAQILNGVDGGAREEVPA